MSTGRRNRAQASRTTSVPWKMLSTVLTGCSMISLTPTALARWYTRSCWDTLVHDQIALRGRRDDHPEVGVLLEVVDVLPAPRREVVDHGDRPPLLEQCLTQV